MCLISRQLHMQKQTEKADSLILPMNLHLSYFLCNKIYILRKARLSKLSDTRSGGGTD